MEGPISHIEMLKTMSVPNNFIGRSTGNGSGISMSVGKESLKNKYVTSKDFLSWTDEKGLSYTFINDPAVKNFLNMQGYSEVHGFAKMDTECVGNIGTVSFESAMNEPYSVDGSGILYRAFVAYANYCANLNFEAFSEANEIDEPDPLPEIEKMYGHFMSGEVCAMAESAIPGYNAEKTGLDLIEKNEENFRIVSSFSQDEDFCQ